MKILILNGVNLNLLGKRDSAQYGSDTILDIKEKILDIFTHIEFEFYQSNSEGDLIEKVQYCSGYDGLIINPGAFSHTSIGLRDALEILKIHKIEVHLSNLSTREEFRSVSLTASKCDGYISGLKEYGYLAAVFVISEKLKAISLF